MSVGNKQKRIRIETPNLVSDGAGGMKPVPGGPPYVLRCVVAAHERPLSGQEALAKAQLAATLASVWEIWFRDDISAKDRIRYKARVIEIDSYQDPTDERDELYLYGTEIQA